MEEKERQRKYKERKYQEGYIQLNVWIPKELAKEIKEISIKDGQTISKTVEKLLRRGLKRWIIW